MTLLQLMFITIIPAILNLHRRKMELTVGETVELLENDILDKFLFRR